jgi:hypothetical protein
MENLSQRKFVPDENSSPSNLFPKENFKLDDFFSFGGYIESA